MTGDVVEILPVVEDDSHDVELLLRALRSEKVETGIDVVRDGEQALALYWLNVNRSPFSRDQRRVPPVSPPASFE
jgi:hypothetical protein